MQGLLFGEEDWGRTWLESDGNQLAGYIIAEFKSRIPA